MNGKLHFACATKIRPRHPSFVPVQSSSRELWQYSLHTGYYTELQYSTLISRAYSALSREGHPIHSTVLTWQVQQKSQDSKGVRGNYWLLVMMITMAGGMGQMRLTLLLYIQYHIEGTMSMPQHQIRHLSIYV